MVFVFTDRFYPFSPLLAAASAPMEGRPVVMEYMARKKISGWRRGELGAAAGHRLSAGAGSTRAGREIRPWTAARPTGVGGA
jgi:hypothetical protein